MESEDTVNRESAQSTSRARSAESARQEELLRAMQSVQAGDFSVRVSTDWESIHGKLADAFNDIIAANERMASELERVGYGVGKQGKTKVRFSLGGRGGAWEHMEGTVNTLIEDLLWPTQDVTRIIAAVAKGDLSQTMSLEVEGRPLEGAFLRSANIVNTMIAQLSVFSSEVTRVVREFGTEGKLGGQAAVPGVADTWKELTDHVHSMASNLTAQVRNIAEANEALRMEKTREVHKLNQSLTAANIDLARSNRSLQVEILERRNVEDRLRQADRRKDEFLATLAHELRNPLAPIQGALNVRRLSRGEDNDELQEVMERQMRHMVRLVDDLLDVSRITRDRLELRPEPVEMAQVVAVARETVQPMLDAAGQSLVLDMPEEPLRLDADPHRLAQVFANLLSNASKFSEPGSAITMRIAADGDGVEVAVRDQGIGIAREELRDIFEMFTQADPSLERARGGLGIGLSLSRRLAEMHGGQLSARSDGPGRAASSACACPCAPARPRPNRSVPRLRPRWRSRGSPCACWWWTTTATRPTCSRCRSS